MAWSDSVVTAAGVDLLKDVLSGGQLNIGSASGGTGTVDSAALMAQTGLVNEKQTLSLVSIDNYQDAKRVKIQISNAELDTGYTLNQIGVWASVDGGIPVLFMIMQDAVGMAIPSNSEIENFVFEFYAAIDFSNESQFTVTVDMTSLVTMTTLTETVGPMNISIEQIQQDLEDANAAIVDLDTRTGALSLTRSNKDVNDIYVTLTYSRADGTLFKTSVLSGGTSPEYTTRTVTFYEADGTTVSKTESYTLTYTDGELTSEVIA
jgi:hypothetical protein